ncbi:galactokinase [Corynebacterium sp. sy017]|nr:galactokinase [Corynebacterium sp. sy017]TSD92556.1 galactokinase [Corynebacterium sp. SY003]
MNNFLIQGVSMTVWQVVEFDLTDYAVRVHREKFGQPTAAATAPASYSLMGEHTDHYGGMVLTGLSHLRLAVAISPRKDTSINVHEVFVDPQTQTPHTQQWHSNLSNITQISAAQADKNTADRLCGVIFTMTQRQLLSRDTTGFDITILGTIPHDEGLGYRAAVDVATALAVARNIEDTDSAPTKAKIADVCFQAANTYSEVPASRSRYSTIMRGHGSAINVINYADGSITQASHPVGAATQTAGFFLVPRTGDTAALCEQAVAQRNAFIEQATRAFGAETLFLLPEAPSRVIDWLRAVHEVNGHDGMPSIADASNWLSFLHQETQDVIQAAQAIRSRRHTELFPLLERSQFNTQQLYGLTNIDTALHAFARQHNALSARSLSAGVSGAILAIVSENNAEEFLDACDAKDAIIIPLSAGEAASIHFKE